MNEPSIVNIKLPTGGMISSDDAKAYADVIESAISVHLNREAIRKGLWKRYPARDQCNQIKVKIDRILHSLDQIAAVAERNDEILKQNILEELDDIINYAVFAARQIKGTA